MFTALTVFYFALIGVCGGYIAFSFIVGELADFGADVADHIDQLGDGISHALDSLGNIFGGLSGGADIDAGDADIGGIDSADAGDSDTDSSHGPSPFSLRTVCMLAVGFGAGGIAGKGLGMPDLLSLAPASGVGIVFWALMWFILRFLYASQGSTSVQATDYIGLIGRVSITIPEKGKGGVNLIVKEERRIVPAYSEDGSAIPAQAEVAVISMEGGVLIVKKI